MSDHAHEAPMNSAKILLPVVIIGMLCLMIIMYKFGGNAGVSEYQNNDHGAVHATKSGH